MKKCIYDMIIEYSCNRFGAMKRGYERFNNLLTDEIKQGMDAFKPFTVYDRKKDMIFNLLCDKQTTNIKCETRRSLVTLDVNTLNQTKLRRLRNNAEETAEVIRFAVENKSTNEITCYSIAVNRVSYDEFTLIKRKSVWNSKDYELIELKENDSTKISYEELENVFATATSLEIISF